VLHGYNLRYLEAEIGGLQFEDSKSQNVNKILSLKKIHPHEDLSSNLKLQDYQRKIENYYDQKN
jgi:hypothetical protein